MMRNKKYKIILILLVSGSLISFFIFLKYLGRIKGPNILLITMDSLRADHLGCYGYKRNTSSHIDSLASKGCLFTQAISQSSWTSASISSILTSLYPSHELIEVGYSLSAQDPNLIKTLKGKGYVTALFSGGEQILSITLNNIKDTFDIFYVKDEKSDIIIRQVNNWLNKNTQFPFFLWVHLFEPHSPYTPPSSYYIGFLSDNLYPNKEVRIAEDDGVKNEFYSFGVIPRVVAEGGITDTSYYIAKYDGEIKFVDEQIGKLFNQLNKLKLENNTLIIFCSDHGESMTEHNFYFNHAHFLFEELIKVPLIIVFPKGIPKNKVILQQVQLIDIMPTILDFVGVKSNGNMEGKSLVPLIRGKISYHTTYAFSESSFFPQPQCIRTEDWKLIYHRKMGNYKLYNLREDPKELENLSTKYPEVAVSLKRSLDEWFQNAHCHRVKNRAIFSEEEKERLRLLGYVQ